MILTIHRDEQFRLTNDFKVTFLAEPENVGWMQSVSVRQEMTGPWNFAFDKLDLSVREASAEPRDESTARLFEENPDLRQDFTPRTQGFLESLRFEVKETAPNELLLGDSLFGTIRFSRFQR